MWTPGDALLQAIQRSPYDDVPRLVYADWLEEHGEEARGEFIRHQCELERLPMDSPRRPELEDRCDDLLAEHEEQWLGPIPGCLGEWAFRRGFVESLTLHDETSLEMCGSLFQRHPIRLAHLRCGGKAALELPSSPCQGRLEDLHLILTTEQEDFFAGARYRPILSCVTGLCEIDCWDVKMLVALRHLPCAPTLRKLGMWGCDGIGTLEYLLSDGAFPELNTFLMGLDYLGPEDDLAVLTETGRGDRWQELRIGGRLRRTDMQRLARCARLERLELGWQEPMAADPLQLPAALTELCVNDRNVTGSLLPVLARAPGLEMLRSLRLHMGRIGETSGFLPTDLHALHEVLGRLRGPVLDLDLYGFQEGTVADLARLDCLDRLRSLQIREDAVVKESELLALLDRPLTGLRRLTLPVGELTPGGLRLLAAAPALVRLRSLSLVEGSIGKEGLLAILESSHLRRLTQLTLARLASEHSASLLGGWPGLRRLRTLSVYFPTTSAWDLRLLLHSTQLNSLMQARIGAYFPVEAEHVPSQELQELRSRMGCRLELPDPLF